MHSSRKEKILQSLKNYGCNIIEQIYPDITTQLGCDTMHIASDIGILRNNVSMELNLALKENLVLKISGKPVLYIDKALLENKYEVKISKYTFNDFASFKAYLLNQINNLSIKNASKNTSIQKNTLDKKARNTNSVSSNHDVFDDLIGITDDLFPQSKQAKAAILYPPHGLHTLLTGPTGSGKTTFASVMYRYAVEMKTISKNAPFIIFNCADYAENTQLLLSHLFGYVKGAFTGAFKETDGLIGKADGGILFLDEIHRLPPEGQEMLFSLIDYGKYRKLGETENYHQASVLILAATTENPQSAILKTFFRRIPILIALPALNERPLKVRMKLINHFFQAEAKVIKKTLVVSKEVLKVLLTYPCSGNVGQLHNDIQVLCANAFIENIISDNSTANKNINVNLSQLNDNLKNEFFRSADNRQELYKVLNFNDVNSVTFDGTNDCLSNLLIKDDYAVDANFYEYILKAAHSFYDNGLTINELKEKIYAKLHNKKITMPTSPKINKAILSKIINTDLTNIIKHHLLISGIAVDNKIIYSLALHLEMLTDRVKKGQFANGVNVKKIMHDHPSEYTLAKNICEDTSHLFNICIPNAEIAIVASFFYTIKQTNLPAIPIIVICHGRSTASSMVEVVKTLIGNTKIYAIDMPLNAKISITLSLAIRLAERVNRERGILILTDMGSLVDFGAMITQKTSIPIKTISNISTPLLLEAARRCMMPNTNLEAVVKLLNNQLNCKIKTDYNDYPSAIFPWASSIEPQLLKKILSTLVDITTFIDTKKATDLLGQSLINVLEHYKQPLTERIFIKYIFHCICMLERIIRKEELPYKNYKKTKKNNKSLFTTIKNSFSSLEEIYGITIPSSELAYITDMFLVIFPSQAIL